MIRFIRNLFTSKPAPVRKKCTNENVAEILGNIISHKNNSRLHPETVSETQVNDMLSRVRGGL